MKKVLRMKAKSGAKGDAKIPKEHRFAFRVQIQLAEKEAEQVSFFDARKKVGQMVDEICKQNNLAQVLDFEKVEETRLRVMWDDTLIELSMEALLSELPAQYGIEQGDAVVIYRNS